MKPEGFLNIDVMPFGEAQALMMARDITRLYRANQTRRDFVANVSHELRTPVTVIRGYLETLAEDRVRCPEAWTSGRRSAASWSWWWRGGSATA